MDQALHSGRIGLAVMRMQPPHRGHMNLISRMLQDCDLAIVAFGSTQVAGDARHPYTYDQRVTMVRAICGEALAAVPLIDLADDISHEEWTSYVLGEIAKAGLPAPTDYYSGSASDAAWYESHFARLTDPVTHIAMSRTYTAPATNRRLHIIDRVLSTLPAAEELRAMISAGDPTWQLYVPERLIGFIENNYPAHLKIAL